MYLTCISKHYICTSKEKAIIAYFTVTVEAGVDLVLIQSLLLYYVDHVVLMQIVFFLFLTKFTSIRKGRKFNCINLSLTFTQTL